MAKNSKTRHPAGPVITGRLPVISCAVCPETMAYRPEPGRHAQARQAAALITGHYRQAHPDLARR